MHTAGRTLGRYELIARIGEGGMAEVHLARQRGPKAFEKLVVVKTVHSKLASRPALAEALLDEAKIAAKVKHPHVVDIYDLGEEDGTYFIAMEYLEGESMTAIIRAQRAPGGTRLPPLRTARIVADCAAGLHAAHELRSLSGEPLELVHQDVTPGNVIVLYTGQAKLVDFGVAKVRTSSDASLVKGKAGYLAPELFEKRPADRRSDVFALGVVLWESLTLRRLFSGTSEADTFAKIKACNVPPPSAQILGAPPELDRICARALARSPDERYPTAKAMLDDLNALLRGTDKGDYEPIATYMRTTFAAQIAARQQLFRELDKGDYEPRAIAELAHQIGEGSSAAIAADASPVPAPTSAEAAPVEAAPAPAEAAPVDVAPVAAAPAHAAPAEAAPVGAAPVEAAPVDVAPVVAAPAHAAPAEPGPAQPSTVVAGAVPLPVPAPRADSFPELGAETISVSQLVSVSGPVAAPRTSRRFLIAAGAGACALGVLVALLAIAGSKSTRPAQVAGAAARGEAPAATTPPPDPAAQVVAPPPIDPPPMPATNAAGSATNPGVDPALTEPAGADRVDPRPVVAKPTDPAKVARDPARAPALAQEGLQRFVRGDTRGAIASFQAALREDKSYAPAHRGLGLAYEKRGDKARAARAFRTYLALAPSARDAAQIRARLEAP